ncbi:unnamed protein product [Lathyrus oleraceus]
MKMWKRIEDRDGRTLKNHHEILKSSTAAELCF